jgi:hypothetical protein
MLPEKNIGVAVLSNMHLVPYPLPNFLPTALAMQVFDSFLGSTETDWSQVLLTLVKEDAEKWFASLKTIDALRVSGTEPSISYEELAGTYSNRAFGELNIKQVNGKTILKIRGAHEGELEHWHYDVFRVNWIGPRQPYSFSFVEFGTDVTGKFHELNIQGLGVFRRVHSK